MRLLIRFLWGGLLLVGAPFFTLASEQPLLGFSPAQKSTQLELEARFDDVLDSGNLREWMERLTARPHHLGSPYGKINAHWLAEQFKAWGYQTKIEVFTVLFPTPQVRVVELLEPIPFKARLREPPLKEDRTSGQQQELLPGYNAYSKDGDVTAQLLYVNYGIPADYTELERLGIDVAGKIVIARYGGSWRGIKPKLAAEKGAVGCILYSDPREDGFYRGDVYPQGAFRSEFGVQRGSVLDIPLRPGDPLTPGAGATLNATRIAIAEAETLPTIPVLPISHADAMPLLSALEGPAAPQNWRGALPLTYHIGPGPAVVHLQIEHSWQQVPVYDVIAMLEGHQWPDQWIIRGNHHDAWVHGASDPVSSLVAMLEEARAIGTLAASGWRPRRTLVYAAWDGEEPGLLGSTEWAEAHMAVLKEKGVVYVNSDSNGRGFLSAGGSHTLEEFFGQVARDVDDPLLGISVAERARSRALVNGTPQQQEAARERATPRLSALGSGSDYTPFLQHLGIASLNIGFGGESGGGVYHSLYDSFDHYTRFGDPEFAYGIALTQTGGRIMLRLAEAELLPFEFRRFGQTLAGYIGEIGKLIDSMRDETDRLNRLIEEGRFQAAGDPLLPNVLPTSQGPVPHLNTAPLHNALSTVQESAQSYAESLEALGGSVDSLTAEQLHELNRILLLSERALVSEAGLPGRPWFKHQIYAPGFYTGYGVKTLPGVREALEARNWNLAGEQITIVSELLHRFADQIDLATTILIAAQSVPEEQSAR